MKRLRYDSSISNAVEDFLGLLEKYPDQPKYLLGFTSFLRGFLRIKEVNEVLPAMEIMTVLKHERPLIFSLMREQSGNWIYTLTQFEMDIEEAKERLSRFTD
jgi:hypothetical protein